MPRAVSVAAIGGGLVLVIVVGLLLTRPDLDSQAAAFFQTLNQALADGDAADAIDLLDPDYDIPTLWPRQADDLRRFASPDAADAYRSGLQKALAFDLLSRRQSERPMPQVDTTITSVEELSDGTVAVVVSFQVNEVRQVAASHENIRLVFTQNGWLRPALRLRSHDLLGNR